jgi:hypothetical protein
MRSLVQTQREDEAQLSQLRNDVAAATVGLRLVADGGDDLGSRLDDLETKIDGVDSRADCLNRELDDVETMGQYYIHASCRSVDASRPLLA